jgi:hypothetical protein
LWCPLFLRCVQAIEKIEPKYKPSQAALTAFFKLHEPADENWKAPFAVLEVTDGCPLNGMYRRSAPCSPSEVDEVHSFDNCPFCLLMLRVCLLKSHAPCGVYVCVCARACGCHAIFTQIAVSSRAPTLESNRFKMWIREGMTAFPNLKLKTVPGMDPIMQVIRLD